MLSPYCICLNLPKTFCYSLKKFKTFSTEIIQQPNSQQQNYRIVSLFRVAHSSALKRKATAVWELKVEIQSFD